MINDTVKTLLERRSCRSFAPEHLDRDTLETIVQAGLKAPSGKNMQTPRFVVVTNDQTVEKLSAMNAAVMGASSDPFYGGKDVIVTLAAKQGGNYVYDGALAVGNMLNAAYSMGLGCIWINRAKEVFDSPEGKALLKKWGVEGDMEGISFCVVGKALSLTPLKEVVPGRLFFVE